MKYLRTSDLAKAVGIHPNTVRKYVDWGLLPPVERDPNGYRRFTERHLDCLRLARLIYASDYPGKAIRQTGQQVILSVVAGNLGGALEIAYRHLGLVQAERAQADAAAAMLERWSRGVAADATGKPLQIGETARLLGVSVDVLRNWERNGLIQVPRNPANGYRYYGAQEIGRLRVIRMLCRSGYSLMAILRMLLQLESGGSMDVRQALDTPRSDEDVYMASDHWISTLKAHEQIAYQAIDLVEEMIRKETA